MFKHPISQYELYSRFIFMALIAFILLTFNQHGISNDEFVQHTYGQLLLKWYASGFSDDSAFHYVNLYLYGGLFDLLAAILEKLTSLWVWDLRHLLTAMFALMGFLATKKMSELIAGPRAGVFALLLLVLTAPWFGAMFTHTKDIPFACCMAWALYYTLLTCKHLDAIPTSVSVKLGLAVGCALGLRIGAVFAVIYLLLAILMILLLRPQSIRAKLQSLWSAAKSLMPAALVAFILMAVLWPWGVMSPTHPFEAIKTFSHFSFSMKTIDNGMFYSIGEVPRSYLLDYLRVKLPEVFLIGLAGFVTVLIVYRQSVLGRLQKDQQRMLVPLHISVLFPITYVYITQPALYNGVRHFTFIIPPLAVIAALGLHFVFECLAVYTHLKRWFWVLLIIMSSYTFLSMLRLHPYEYVFYNQLAGQQAETASNWEADYWSSGLREAAKGLMAMPLEKRETPYKVAVCAENIQGQAYLDQRFEVSKDWTAADFYMSTTHMHCDQVLQGDKIVEVKRNDLILTVVKDRRRLTGQAREPIPAPTH